MADVQLVVVKFRVRGKGKSKFAKICKDQTTKDQTTKLPGTFISFLWVKKDTDGMLSLSECFSDKRF